MHQPSLEALSTARFQYRSGEVTAWFAVIALALMAVVKLFSMTGVFFLILSMNATGQIREDSTFGGLALVLVIVGIVLSFVLAPLVAILFLIWTHRVSTNVRCFGNAGLRHSPGSASWWYFVPIANLVMPYLCMKETWKGSDPRLDVLMEPNAWTRASVGLLLPAWWLTWGLGLILGPLGGHIGRSGDVILGSWVRFASFALLSVAAFLAILLVFQLTERQKMNAARLKSELAESVSMEAVELDGSAESNS